jgi:hypothetical protein
MNYLAGVNAEWTEPIALAGSPAVRVRFTSTAPSCIDWAKPCGEGSSDTPCVIIFSRPRQEIEQDFPTFSNAFAIGTDGYVRAAEGAVSSKAIEKKRIAPLAKLGHLICGLVFEGKNPSRNGSFAKKFVEVGRRARKAGKNARVEVEGEVSDEEEQGEVRR